MKKGFALVKKHKTVFKQIILSAVVLVVIYTLGIYLLTQFKDKKPLYKANNISNMSKNLIYQDKSNMFSFQYPDKFRIIHSKAYEIGFQDANNNLENAIAIIEIEELDNNENVKDHTIRKFSQWLKGKTQGIKWDTNTYETRVIGQKDYPFENKNRVKGNEIYITLETTTQKITGEEKINVREWGPVFVMEISKKSAKQALMVHSFDDATADSKNLLNIIANTINIEK